MRSKLKNVLISPRKMGLVAALIRGMNVSGALQLLRFTNKKAADLLSKGIQSAASNAKKPFNTLRIDKVDVGRGPIYERFIPRGRGGSDTIKKYTTNVSVVLVEEQEGLQSSTVEKIAVEPTQTTGGEQ